MADSPLRLVIDTNVLLAGLVSKSSPSQRVIDALQARRAIPLLSAPVLAEYRAVLLNRNLMARFANLSQKRVELALRRLRYIGDQYRVVTAKFELERDPRDAMFVELAIVGRATHIVTLDPDILSLSKARTGAAKRFRQRLPGTAILRPAELVEQHAHALGFE